MMTCGCRFDEDASIDPSELEVDGNGVPFDTRWLGAQEVAVHYDDLPESDVCTVQGMRVTTPLRTAIDIAPEVGEAELERIVREFLGRGSFTVEEARRRVAERDIADRPGALMLGRVVARIAAEGS
jgi:hypothetical protein